MDKINYYSRQGVAIMGRIEDEAGKMMSDIDAVLEANFWAAIDSKDEKRARNLYFQLCRLCDSFTIDSPCQN